ncbi:hypothetical protein BD309DRAFT_1014057 [Dichomitus squalens]|uniref:Uncharacterized protein n=1 Tax=Dichomitus squalens TaxID=114155 RepID=A0A4Q9PB42_9APHY|nr:uncharacterized protein DICSQDRAFT_133460 [Dichomitus squalens LYAD-421 SS1]EJF64730.1 hypothetical protein DICSQDRAFT_133460 [Dichomitus squalens LYAD-421 SS1]TBU50437.1 hypothetical protein BD309DRAFT_1014057 [Dichomitus squalens]TBU62974.1 hypothetical protein BD310DRAFT_809552 [Dichomitus squalens]
MQLTTILTLAGVALSAAFGVSAKQDAKATTIWQPTATVVQTKTYTGTRVEEIWTTTPPYEWLTTYPITWTATETETQYKPVVTNVARQVVGERRHARDFQQS